jgi:threonine synthase
MNALALRWICSGCGHEVPADDPPPFRCPAARPGDDVDHVLVRHLDPQRASGRETVRSTFLDPQPHPFLRYRPLLHLHHFLVARLLGEDIFTDLVWELDAAVARVEPTRRSRSGGRTGGRPDTVPALKATEPQREDRLARALGLPEGVQVWVKDETTQPGGSHKIRHLFGVLLWLEAARRLRRSPSGEIPGRGPKQPTWPWPAAPRLAIASCGNAALAAAILARAAGYELSVFVPPDAPPAVLARLDELGARIEACPREAGKRGDPCLARFRDAVARGAVSFTCQGSENGLVIESGATLGYEIVSAMLREGFLLDRLFVQVGGGALASSCVLAFRDAVALGLLARMPRIHAVQTRGGYPLARAWERLVGRILQRTGRRAAGWAEMARAAAEVDPEIVAEEIRHAARHRSRFMWPWETPPRSVATGILDDETYDWLAIVRGMLETGGWPLVVSEEELREAHETVRRATGIPADPTGTAGVAGLLSLAREKALARDEKVAVLLTGRERA